MPEDIVRIEVPLLEIFMKIEQEHPLLTDENIDLLLKGRDIVDSHKWDKAVVNSKQATWGERDEERKKLTGDLARELRAINFLSLGGFAAFNDDMCLAEHEDYLPLISYCDKCKDYKETPPCLKTCGKQAAYNTWTGTDEDKRNFRKFTLRVKRNMEIAKDGKISVKDSAQLNATAIKPGDEYDVSKFSICPEGHGFQFKYAHEPRFDVTWTV